MRTEGCRAIPTSQEEKVTPFRALLGLLRALAGLLGLGGGVLALQVSLAAVSLFDFVALLSHSLISVLESRFTFRGSWIWFGGGI